MRLVTLIVVLFLAATSSQIASAQNTGNSDGAEILSKENVVDTAGASAAWRPASVGQKLIWHDRLRTGEDSRAAVRMSDSSVLRIDELTETEILPPQVASAKPTVDLKQGTGYFFSREKSREINVQTPAANGAIRGTEFVVTVAANGHTSFTMLDGEVEVSNAQGSVVVRSGERADVEPGRKPTKTAVIEAINSVQWCLYYPGVLDLNDLKLSPEPGTRCEDHSRLTTKATCSLPLRHTLSTDRPHLPRKEFIVPACFSSSVRWRKHNVCCAG